MEMLSMGVFEGKYLNDCMGEFPREWYKLALSKGKLSPVSPDCKINEFKIKSRQSLQVWRKNKWSPLNKDDNDIRGWFQWYCRYWMGRRMPELDSIQIGRWRSFARHAGAVRKRCAAGDLGCSPRERQALLQWAYDPFI
jgi:hypothetical protein